MAVCLLASIGLDGDDVVYLGPDGAQWRLPLDDVRLIGVFAAPGDAEDPAFAFVRDPDAAWFQASCNAVGADRLLAELSARLGSSVRAAAASPLSLQDACSGHRVTPAASCLRSGPTRAEPPLRTCAPSCERPWSKT
jgi:hypothetical protein